jgi:hypothetical protein
VMGTVGKPIDVSDESGRYVRLPQEAQTPHPPRRSRSGKENDGEAVSPSQLPPRISTAYRSGSPIYRLELVPQWTPARPRK